MSDLFYRQAVTEDGEPVAVTEPDWSTVAERFDDGAVKQWATRPCSWALILPGDTVLYDHDAHDDGLCVVLDIRTEPGGRVLIIAHAGASDEQWEAWPADLTLVCGEPSELRRQNPTWRWD